MNTLITSYCIVGFILCWHDYGYFGEACVLKIPQWVKQLNVASQKKKKQ